MKRIFLFWSIIGLLLTACTPYGDKVEINSNSEVFYKEGVTEADAQRLGDFLLRKNFFDDANERSVQLTKDSGVYVVHFVVDRPAYEKDKENTLLGFKVWQMWIADSVFPNAKTRVVLTDQQFGVYEDVGEFTQEEQAAIKAEQEGLLNPEKEATAADSSRIDNTDVEEPIQP